MVRGYRSQHELVFVFKLGSGPHRNNVQLSDPGHPCRPAWGPPSMTPRIIARITPRSAMRRPSGGPWKAYEAHNNGFRTHGVGRATAAACSDGWTTIARDAYIRRLGNAWKALPDLPARDPDDDDDPKAAATAVEAQRRRWNAESPTKDAALADRDTRLWRISRLPPERLEEALRGGRRREALTTKPAEELDGRIAAAFSDDANSSDAARLLAEVKEATAAAELAAETARKHALDPVLSGDDLKLARREMDDAAFKRDRLQEARRSLPNGSRP